MKNQERIYKMKFASVYPLYVAKLEKKGRTRDELNAVIQWLTGWDASGLEKEIASQNDFENFFLNAPHFNTQAMLIKGSICGYRVEEIEDPIVRKVRILDKLVDDLAKGKKLEKLLSL